MEPQTTDGMGEPGSEAFSRASTLALGATMLLQAVKDRQATNAAANAADHRATKAQLDAQAAEQGVPAQSGRAGSADAAAVAQDTTVDPRPADDLPELDALIGQWQAALGDQHAPGAADRLRECERQLRRVSPELMQTYDALRATGEGPAASMHQALARIRTNPTAAGDPAARGTAAPEEGAATSSGQAAGIANTQPVAVDESVIEENLRDFQRGAGRGQAEGGFQI